MKKLIVILLIFGTANSILAQAREENTNLSMSSPSRKNEIGFLASPVGIVLLGGSPSGQRVGISYKRNNGKKYLFTGGLYYAGYQNPYPFKEFTVQIDKNQREIQTSRERNNRGSLSLGIERRWPMKTIPALTKFLGAELTAGYGENDQGVFRQWMELDSLNGTKIPGQEVLNPTGAAFLCYRKITKTISTGLALNAGLQLKMSERFYAMVQFSMALDLGFQEIQEQNFLTGETGNYKTSVFDFNQRGIIGDIGVYYRF